MTTSNRATSEPSNGAQAALRMPKLSLIVATISERPQLLRRLLDSVTHEARAQAIEVIVVDQDASGQSKPIVQSMRDAGLDAQYVYLNRRGLSRARNEGMRHARGRYVAFPDDDAWYGAGVLSEVLGRFERQPHVDVWCGMQVTSLGRPSMLRWQTRPGRVGRYNVIRTAISSAIFMKRDILVALGGFAEDLGVGSDGQFGAAEETDLLLRALDRGARVQYDPTLRVHQEDIRPVDSDAFRRKRASYGCGVGEVLRRHSYPFWYGAYLTSRKAVLIALLTVRGRGASVPLEVAWTRGFIAGISGRRPRVAEDDGPAH